MAVAHIGQDRLSPDELMDALEEIRSDYTGGNPAAARRRPPDTPEKLAAEKRRIHKGGDGNHRFEGERYLNIRDDKAVRRFQLRKLIDEGGQDSVGGPVPSHPTLQRWNSEEVGVSKEEIDRLEREDALPEAFVRNGWWYFMHRTEPWPVLLGSALVSEGAKRLPAVREAQLRDLDETRELYESWGIKNIERAMKNQVEHSPIGADDDHVVFGENMTRAHVNTPELQERLRKVFTLRVQQSKA
jgi:pyrroloquinoline quinone (PQQ) biosynthesis protein C